MATPHGDGGYPTKRYTAKYKCNSCQETWKTRNTSHLRMVCKNRDCRKTVRAYKFEVINKLVVYQCDTCFNKIKKTKCSSEVKEVPYCSICQKDMKVYILKDLWRKKRMFGHFYCDQCHNEWKSGYAWDGVGQKCRLCQIMVLPHSLQPLKFSHSSDKPSQPHREDLCEMCKQLGHSCKNYKPSDEDIAMIDEIPLEEDTQSVITTNSSVAGGDEGGDGSDSDSTGGGDRTPINSDDDDDNGDVDGIGGGTTDNIQTLFSKMKLHSGNKA